MSSPSHTPNPSPTQSPSQSRSNNVAATPTQQRSSTGGLVQSPSPSPTRGGSSSHQPSHPPTPTHSQSSSRASSLTPSPHVQHTQRGSASQVPSQPASKSPSQTGFKPSRNPSQTPSMPVGRSPAPSPAGSASFIGPVRNIPSFIAPYVPRFMKEPSFFQPPTSPLPYNHCFPCDFPCPSPPPPKPPDAVYFPLLPPPPHHPQASCSYPTPPALFTPPSSLSYSLPIDVLVGGKPHVAPTVLPATFYTPFSRYYFHPRARRTPRRWFSSLTSLSPASTYDMGSGRSVHFFRGS